MRLFSLSEFRKMKKMAKFAVFALLVSSALSACNTFHGFGEDVSHLGGAISHAAEK